IWREADTATRTDFRRHPSGIAVAVRLRRLRVADCLRKRSQSAIGASLYAAEGDRHPDGAGSEQGARAATATHREFASRLDRRDAGLSPGVMGNPASDGTWPGRYSPRDYGQG